MSDLSTPETNSGTPVFGPIGSFTPTPPGKNWRDIATFVVSLVTILGIFAWIFAITFYPTRLDQQIVGLIQGSLLTILAGVITYWVGSSIGSSIKNDWKKP